MDLLTNTLLVGLGATALTDVWAILRKRWLRIAAPNYAWVGRWIGHMSRGRLCHAAIQAAPPLPSERLLGWCAHYLIGIGFAAMLPLLCGAEWLQRPSFGPALGVGVATVAAPFLLMQPAMGLGIAASRAPRPGAARLQSLITHAVFGVGLYLSAALLRFAF